MQFRRHLAIATNWPILAAVAVLCALGLVSIWAHGQTDAQSDATKQLIFLGIGLVCLVLFQAVNYMEIGRYAWPFYFTSLALLIYTIVPGVPDHGIGGVPVIKGARAWIDLGAFHLEPAELMKIAFCMALARYLRFRSNYRTVNGLLIPFALAVVPALLILKQPALGMATLFLPTLFAMLFVAGARVKHLAVVVFLGFALLPVLWVLGHNDPRVGHVPALMKPYQWVRIRSLLSGDPHDLQDAGFQQEQALTALGSGGPLGRGLGKLVIGQHVPEAHNDMIFAIIGEQFGFIGSAVVLGAYLVLFAAGIEIGGSTREPFGRLVAIGIVSILAGQVFINLMVVMRLFPVTGITLPFVSYGGSSLLASFMAVGLLLNIAQHRPIIIAKDAFEFAGTADG
jgi:cell division protein FtsW (lipid II flippase)